MRRLFEVNSEPHTGARPSVRLCVGLIRSYGFLSRQVLGRCFTQGLGLARSTCSTVSFKKFPAWVCSNFVKKRSERMVVVHLAGSTIKNTCWDGLDRIFRKCYVLWTSRGHQGCSIDVKKTSWVIDGLKLWSFENFSPNVIMRQYSLRKLGRSRLWS